MRKFNFFGKCLIGMLLVACLAFGGLYGCATSSETGSSSSGSSSGRSGSECTGGSQESCVVNCNSVVGMDYDCEAKCAQVCP